MKWDVGGDYRLPGHPAVVIKILRGSVRTLDEPKQERGATKGGEETQEQNTSGPQKLHCDNSEVRRSKKTIRRTWKRKSRKKRKIERKLLPMNGCLTDRGAETIKGRAEARGHFVFSRSLGTWSS